MSEPAIRGAFNRDLSSWRNTVTIKALSLVPVLFVVFSGAASADTWKENLDKGAATT